MRPPGQLAERRTGGTTSPTKNDLVNAARLILDNCGIAFSTNKIVRLVVKFKERMPHANGHMFFQYLTNAVQMTHEQKRRALEDPDIARAISYADPTGETAVANVMHSARRRLRPVVI